MTLGELKTILDSTQLPVAYLAFPPDQVPAMPFIVYQEIGSNNFGADNYVWFSAMKVQVDLLTAKKDRATEEALETVFNDWKIFWERVPDWDEDEDYYRVTYTIEI